MKVIILAAGKGTRLGNNIPKILTKLPNNETIMDRLLNSIKIIASEYNQELPSNIYVIGIGLDSLIKTNKDLPGVFKRVSDMNLSDYSYQPKQMEIHELVSNSIETTIDTISCITSSCL